MTNMADTTSAAPKPGERCQYCIDRNDGFYGSWAADCPFHDEDGNLRPLKTNPVAATAIPRTGQAEQLHRFLTDTGAPPTSDGWPKLERPAALHEDGTARFGKGVSARLLVEAAYRNAERTEELNSRTSEQRQEDERKRREAWDLIHGSPFSAPAAVTGPSDSLADWALRATPAELNAANWRVVYQGLLRARTELEKTGVTHPWIGPYITIAKQEGGAAIQTLQLAQWPIAPDVAAELERSDWTPEEALRWYAAGRHYDTVPNGDGTSSARILDNGAIASNALKSMSREYAERKGDAALLEAAPQQEPSPALAQAAGLALEVLEKHRQMKGDPPMGMLGHRAMEALKDALRAERDSWKEAESQPTASKGDVLTIEEARQLEKVISDFDDCGETDVPYAALQRFAAMGYLECPHYHVLPSARKAIDAIRTQVKEGGA